MGGSLHNLCDPDFDAVFDQLGATAAGLKHNFRLTSAPVLSTLAVSVRAPCDVKRAALSACTQISDQCGDSPPGLLCTPKNAAVNRRSHDAARPSPVFARAAGQATWRFPPPRGRGFRG